MQSKLWVRLHNNYQKDYLQPLYKKYNGFFILSITTDNIENQEIGYEYFIEKIRAYLSFLLV